MKSRHNPISPLPCRTQVPDRRFGHFHPVGHGDDVLGVARQIARPLLEFIGRHATLEEDDSFLDPDFRRGEPISRIQDALEALADFFITRDGIDVHLRGSQRKIFLGRGRCWRSAGLNWRFLRRDRHDQHAINSSEPRHSPKQFIKVACRLPHTAMPVPCRDVRRSRVHHALCLFDGGVGFPRTSACAAQKQTPNTPTQLER